MSIELVPVAPEVFFDDDAVILESPEVVMIIDEELCLPAVVAGEGFVIIYGPKHEWVPAEERNDPKESREPPPDIRVFLVDSYYKFEQAAKSFQDVIR